MEEKVVTAVAAVFVVSASAGRVLSSVRTEIPSEPDGMLSPMIRPLALDDIAPLQLPSEPTLSPDGRQVIYVGRTVDGGEVERPASSTGRSST